MLTSLRSKIYVGFSVIVTLLVAIGVIGYAGAHQLHDSSTAMRRISGVNAAVLEIDRDVQELQLRVGRYMTSGHDSLRYDIVELNDHLVTLIHEMASNQTDLELRDLFDRMSEHLPEYKKHFDSVIEERKIRADLVQLQLPQQSAVIDSKLSELNSLITESEQTDEIRVALLRCETMFSQAEKLLLRYYVGPDTKFVNRALSNLDSAIASLTEISTHRESAELRQKLIAELKEYERIGVRAVQATRSYLFLVNVVMAGEASEVTYYSDRLRKISEKRRDAISAEVASTAANVQKMTGFGIGIALALALFIAGRLAVLILQPITALTATFKRLASGETLVAIPETDRKDEISQMALAAGVFSDQNRKRQELLEKSEQLTEELAVKADELEATNADLDSFAYVASHDLKSPLRGIRQLATWIDEDAGHLLPAESVRHCHAMQSRVRKMELLLDDLLNFSRIGRTEAEPEDVDVSAILDGISEITNNPYGVSVRWPKHVANVQDDSSPAGTSASESDWERD